MLDLSIQMMVFCFFNHITMLLIALMMQGDITDLAVNINNSLVASASNDYNIRVVSILFAST